MSHLPPSNCSRREERSVVESIHSTFAQAGLVRPQEGRVLAGVIAGLGRRIGLDPWPARLLFVLILLILPGSQLLIYPVLWILMPNEAPAAQFFPVTEEEEAYCGGGGGCPDRRIFARSKSCRRSGGRIRQASRCALQA